MRYLLALLIAVAIAGCASRAERAQHAADADAALRAVSMNLADMLPAIKTLAEGEAKAKLTALVQSTWDIAETARAYLPAVADVPKAELPAPAQTPEAIRADGGKGLKDNAPPDPTGSALWAILGTAGLAALYGIGKVAPGIPGLGPVVGGVANLAWSALAHRDQKAADQAKSAVTDSAQTLQPLLATLRAMPAGILPPPLAAVLANPDVAAAIDHLASPVPTILAQAA